MTSQPPTLYFEDLAAGQVYDLGTVTADRAEMVEFARRYDPQPFHVDADAARQSSFGELVASGWFTVGLFMRLYVAAVLSRAASQGSPGGDEIRWLAPVRPGDSLAGRLQVLSTRPSAHRPDRGTAHLRGELLRATEPMLRLSFFGLFGRRPT